MPTQSGGNGHRDPSLPPAAAAPRRPSRRRRHLVLGLLAVWVVVALFAGYVRDRGWVRVGTLRSVEYFRVVYVQDANVFVVANGSHPVALSAVSPHLGAPILFCREAGLFVDRHGSLFDRFGLYLVGPAPRGMDRIGVRVKGDEVDIKPGTVAPGPPRGSGTPIGPIGPVCQDWNESPAGFFGASPPPR